MAFFLYNFRQNYCLIIYFSVPGIYFFIGNVLWFQLVLTANLFLLETFKLRSF